MSPAAVATFVFAIFGDLLFSYRVVLGCCRITQFLASLKFLAE